MMSAYCFWTGFLIEKIAENDADLCIVFLDVIARYIRGNFSLSFPFSDFVSDSADRTCKEAFQAKDIKKSSISFTSSYSI